MILSMTLAVPELWASPYPPTNGLPEANHTRIVSEGVRDFLSGKTLHYTLYFNNDGTYLYVEEGKGIHRGKWSVCKFDNGFEGVLSDLFGPNCEGVVTIDNKKLNAVWKIYFVTSKDGKVYYSGFDYICQCIAKPIQDALTDEQKRKEIASAGGNPNDVNALVALYRLYLNAKSCKEAGLVFTDTEVENIAKSAKAQEAKINSDQLQNNAWQEAAKSSGFTPAEANADYDAAFKECSQLLTLYNLSVSRVLPKKPF